MYRVCVEYSYRVCVEYSYVCSLRHLYVSRVCRVLVSYTSSTFGSVNTTPCSSSIRRPCVCNRLNKIESEQFWCPESQRLAISVLITFICSTNLPIPRTIAHSCPWASIFKSPTLFPPQSWIGMWRWKGGTAGFVVTGTLSPR